MIANGKKVSWSYQAGGVEFSQEGKIITALDAGNSANEALAAFDASASPRQKKFQDTSSNDRYLIAVKNEHGIYVYYAPTIGAVDKQNPAAVKALEKAFANATPPASGLGDNTPETPASATAPVKTMKQVKEGVKAGRTPALNSEFKKGNATVYRILGINKHGEFVGYRLLNSNRTLKFLVSVEGFNWTYHSQVREAFSGFTRAADSKGNLVEGTLSFPECIKFADSIGKQLAAMGFTKGTTDTLLSDLQKLSGENTTRRAVTAVFSSSKY